MSEIELERVLTRLYTTGMGVADCLRLLGKHDESNQVEVWLLNFLKEMRNEARPI